MCSQPTAVTVVIVTHNSSQLLPELAATLPESLSGVDDHEIVVVDSGSSDDSLTRAGELLPDATIVDLGRNGGYAAGMNAGVAATRLHGAVLILNPDLQPMPGSVARLVAALDAPHTGIVVPRLTSPTGDTQRSLRRRPTVGRALGESLLGGRRAGRWSALGEIVQDEAVYARPATPAWATGAAMCISRSCLDAIGPWNESYFLYSEETEFALRATDAGFTVRYDPGAVMMHIGGESGVSAPLFALLCVNRVRCYAQFHSRAATEMFRLALALGLAARSFAGSEIYRTALTALFKDPGLAVANASTRS